MAPWLLSFQESTTAESSLKDTAVVEESPQYFVKSGNKEYFAACLYTCYDLVRPDVVLKLSWCHGLIDFAMSYIAQFTQDLDNIMIITAGPGAMAPQQTGMMAPQQTDMSMRYSNSGF
ncbi:Clathrin heavy chain [Haplosporangium sp. Z 27]|nr:Clathrin heavy chain [Haplosporangium sp. Z 27]